MNECIHPKEKLYFTIAAVVSVCVYLGLIISVVGIFYMVCGAIAVFVGQGVFIGRLKGNGIKISKQQFPEVYDMVRSISNEMELDMVPDIYILESGGLLNAFATKFLGRNFVIIYSDVLELAYERGESAVRFILCHELAHIKRKHLFKQALIYPAVVVPFLVTAYSRACEYTCDQFAAHYSPDGAVDGLLILASGKKLYRNINVQEICNQVIEENGFWVTLSEILSTHPNLTKRIQKITKIKSIEQI
jgi:Zn-dependent protease with chaperone function